MNEVEWQEAILSVLDGSADNVSLPRLPLTIYDSFIRINGATWNMKDIQGPQGSFWSDYSKGGIDYTLTGDLWYHEGYMFSVLKGNEGE